MNFKYWKLFLSCLSAYLSSVVLGMVVFFTAPAFPSINFGDFGFHLTNSLMSWIASLAALFALPGTLCIVPFMDAFGRKMAIILTTIPMAFGWLVIVCASNVPTFAVGRALTGFALGMQYSTIVLYLSEIAPKQIRGRVCSVFSICAYSGGLLTNLLGSFIDWRWLALLSLAVVSTTSVASVFMCETPRWLIGHGHRDVAIEVMTSLWSVDDPKIIDTEISDIEENLRLVSSLTLRERLRALRKRPLLKPFLICLVLMACQQFTGQNFFVSYSVDIFRMTSDDLRTTNPLFINPNYQSCVMSLAFILGSYLSMVSIDRLGRRVLLIGSSAVIAVSLAAFGTCDYYSRTKENVFVNEYLFWLPLTCLLVYVIGFSLAYGAIPFLLISELMPNSVRSLATGIGMLVKNLSYFIVVKVCGSFHDLPIYTIFWTYAGVAVLSLVFVCFFVPETKGRTLEQIQKQWYKEFNGNNRASDRRRSI